MEDATAAAYLKRSGLKIAVFGGVADPIPQELVFCFAARRNAAWQRISLATCQSSRNSTAGRTRRLSLQNGYSVRVRIHCPSLSMGSFAASMKDSVKSCLHDVGSDSMTVSACVSFTIFIARAQRFEFASIRL
jgi:hypothetical protein